MKSRKKKFNKNQLVSLKYPHILIALFFLSLVIFIPLIVVLASRNNSLHIHAATATAFPHVQGSQIIDEHGNQIVLRGAQIPSELNSTWSGGNAAKNVLNPTIFAAMHSWGMNTLRLPVGAYLYQQTGYMTFLDSVIQQANQAGLYVILSNFEVGSAGGGNGVLDQQGLTFWKFIAQHYATNPMIMYDLINEPKNSSYGEWLNGGGSVVGMQQIVDGIRVAGGQQIIVAEAIDIGTTFFSGFTSFIKDSNIIYSVHIYFKDATERSTSGWDTEFGNLSANYPILVGEWALLPNARYPVFCNGLDATSGTQLVNSFLSYMQQHQISWTAWEFKAPHLIKDTSFTPTVLTDTWCCGLGPVCSAGMGTLIKTFLLSSTTPPPLPSVTITGNPTFTPSNQPPTSFPSSGVTASPTIPQPTGGNSPTPGGGKGGGGGDNGDCDNSNQKPAIQGGMKDLFNPNATSGGKKKDCDPSKKVKKNTDNKNDNKQKPNASIFDTFFQNIQSFFVSVFGK